MKNIFYELIRMIRLARKRKKDPGRQAAEKSLGFKRLGIFIDAVEGAAELVEMLLAEKVVKDDGCAEEHEQKKQEQGAERLVACGPGRIHHNFLFFNELINIVLYCPRPDLSI